MVPDSESTFYHNYLYLKLLIKFDLICTLFYALSPFSRFYRARFGRLSTANSLVFCEDDWSNYNVFESFLGIHLMRIIFMLIASSLEHDIANMVCLKIPY